MSESGKDVDQHQYHDHPDQQQPPPPPHQYGTFQGGHSYQPPVMGFPQPTPPPGAPGGPPINAYAHGYHSVPGYAVTERSTVREPRLPCCGIGVGWFLFIIGFFLAAIPWYLGAFILICAQYDPREKPGYVACLIAAILGTVAVIFGVAS
ncbi:large ribosomal subunit protein eL20z-like [Rutidosis leptorrhynchoides]|uniref:large ribosomal subunit protein eL20z-like n=1 Tax=Rutidosis leptorrhynchoides TaxID=125765 RepID=UPI003A99A8D3